MSWPEDGYRESPRSRADAEELMHRLRKAEHQIHRMEDHIRSVEDRNHRLQSKVEELKTELAKYKSDPSNRGIVLAVDLNIT